MVPPDYVVPYHGEQYVYIPGLGLFTISDITIGLFVIAYIGWIAVRTFLMAHPFVSMAELVKEVAVWALVVGLMTQVTYKFTALPDPGPVLSSLFDEVYRRIYSIANCIVNIQLSGPLSAYSQLAQAKLAPHSTVYDQMMWSLSLAMGVYKALKDWGAALLAIGFLIYAGWMRPWGGMIIGLVAGLAFGLAFFAAAAQNSGIKYTPQHDYYPVQAVVAHCDEELRSEYSDLDTWRGLNADLWLYFLLTPALGAALGAVLGRH